MSLSSIIIIPIYKEIPTDEELVSFRNNINILSNHQIAIVSNDEVDLSFYTNLLEYSNLNYRIDCFDKSYFSSLQSYNKLLLSLDFYKRYAEYDFMLITQLDVFVFSDDLDFWCSKSYDYIGAPWFDRFRNNHRDAKLKKVGNGGFSLRRIQSFIDVFDYAKSHNKKISISNFWNLYEFFECNKFSIKNLYKRVKGIENNFQYYMNSAIQEDVVWSIIVPEVIKTFSVAPIEEAILFSFESDPIYLYHLNDQQLPFGCHAWHKNQYDEFWSQFIKLPNEKLS